VLLSFPWTDKANRMLAWGMPSELPVEVNEEGWDDLEQGWWARAIVAGPDLYLAETDLDEMTDVRDHSRIEYPEPGIVLVDGVPVTWNVVARKSYDLAWRHAIKSCRRFNPSPAGRWDPERRLFSRT
jgi:hypothetical protein